MYTKYKIVPFCPYHFVHTILSNTILSVYHFVHTILSVYHFVHTILSVPFCPLPFCPVTRAVIMFHPNYRLSSRRPIWWSQPAEDMTALSAWCAEWSATDVVNHSLVAVPSVCLLATSCRGGNGAAKPF